MRCDQAKQELKALHDGELRGLTAYTVKRHLRSCAECARAYEQIEELHRTLRSADLFTPAPVSTRHGSRRAVAGLVTAAALTGVVTAALLLAPPGKPARVLAADVRDALRHVKTWHMSGWRMIHGHKVPWEVWGRRSPYLYYERNGDDVIHDDGTVRTYLFAASPELGRTNALVIRTDSQLKAPQFQKPNFQAILDADKLADVFSDPFIKPLRIEKETTIFRRQDPYTHMQGVNINQLLTVRSANRLPLKYQLHYNRVHEEWDTEYLEAAYDVVVPTSVASLAWRADAMTLDLRGQGASMSDRPSDSFMVGGIAVRAVPQSVDSAGNIVMQVSGMLQGRQLPMGWNESTGQLMFWASTGEDATEVPCSDRTGRITQYKYVDVFMLRGGRMDGSFLLSPLASLPEGVSPVSVRHALTISVSVAVAGTDIMPNQGQQYPAIQSVPLIKQAIPVALDLRGAPHQEIRLRSAQGQDNTRMADRNEINRAIFDARAVYLWGSMDYQTDMIPKRFRHEDLMRDPKLLDEYRRFFSTHTKQFEQARIRQLLRACDWLDREIDLMPATDHRQRILRLDKLMQLGIWYKQAGRKDLAQKTWRQLLQEATRVPEQKRRIKDAKDALAGKGS